jgi:uncharacterized protein (DUF934 family)
MIAPPCACDRARLWRNERGEMGFRVIVGGGLGRTPVIGKTLRSSCPRTRLCLSRATLRVCKRYGATISKGPHKILAHELGAAKTREKVEAEYAQIKDGALKLAPETIESIARQFAPPALPHRPAVAATVEALKLEDPDFALWLKSNTAPHRMAGYRIVTASLKPAGAPPGDASSVQMEGVADIADAYSQGEIRVSDEENLVLPHVAVEDLPVVGRALVRVGFAEATSARSPTSSSPGLDYCAGQRALDPGRAGISPLSPIGRSTTSVISRSRSRAHQRLRPSPSVISGILASTRTGSSSTRSAWAATSISARRRSARSSVRPWPPTRLSRRWTRWWRPISTPAPTESASSTLIGASAPSPSRIASMTLFRETGVVEDPWQKLDDDASVPADGMVLVSYGRWREARAALLARRGPVGVALANTDPVDALASDVSRLDLIALHFPKFSDGRAYSQARLLRERLGYQGELRATGNVLQDQASFMLRCGFDSFESEQKGFGEALARARTLFSVVYQPTEDGRATASLLRLKLRNAVVS